MEKRPPYLSIRVAGSVVVASSPFTKYANYIIEIAEGGRHKTITRRFRNFVDLHYQIQAAPDCGSKILPQLPPKRLFGALDPDFLEQRRQALNVYLESLVAKGWPSPLFLFLDLLPETIAIIRFLTLPALPTSKRVKPLTSRLSLPVKSRRRSFSSTPSKWKVFAIVGRALETHPRIPVPSAPPLSETELDFIRVIGELFSRRKDQEMLSRLTYFSVLKRLVYHLLADMSDAAWSIVSGLVLGILTQLVINPDSSAKSCLIKCRAHVRLLDFLSKLAMSNLHLSILTDTAKEIVIALAVHDPISFLPLFRMNSGKDAVVSIIIRSSSCVSLHSFIAILMLVCFVTADARGSCPDLHKDFTNSVLPCLLTASPSATVKIVAGLMYIKLGVPLSGGLSYPSLLNDICGCVSRASSQCQFSLECGPQKFFTKSRVVFSKSLIPAFAEAYRNGSFSFQRQNLVEYLERITRNTSRCTFQDVCDMIVCEASAVSCACYAVDLPICLLACNLLGDLFISTLSATAVEVACQPDADTASLKFLLFVCLLISSSPEIKEYGRLVAGSGDVNLLESTSGQFFSCISQIHGGLPRDQAPFFFFCDSVVTLTSQNSFLGSTFLHSSPDTAVEDSSFTNLSDLQVSCDKLFLGIFAETKLLELHQLLAGDLNSLCFLARRSKDETLREWAAALFLFSSRNLAACRERFDESPHRIVTGASAAITRVASSVSTSAAVSRDIIKSDPHSTGRDMNLSDYHRLCAIFEDELATLDVFCTFVLRKKIENEVERLLEKETEFLSQIAQEIDCRIKPPPSFLLEDTDGASLAVGGRPDDFDVPDMSPSLRNTGNTSPSLREEYGRDGDADVVPHNSTANICACRWQQPIPRSAMTSPREQGDLSRLSGGGMHSVGILTSGESDLGALEVVTEWVRLPQIVSRLSRRVMEAMGHMAEGTDMMRMWRHRHVVLISSFARTSEALKTFLLTLSRDLKSHGSELDTLRGLVDVWSETEARIITLDQELEQTRRECQTLIRWLVKTNETRRRHSRHIQEARELLHRLKCERIELRKKQKIISIHEAPDLSLGLISGRPSEEETQPSVFDELNDPDEPQHLEPAAKHLDMAEGFDSKSVAELVSDNRSIPKCHTEIKSVLERDNALSTLMKESEEALNNLLEQLPQIEAEANEKEERAQHLRLKIDDIMDEIYKERRGLGQVKSSIAQSTATLVSALEKEHLSAFEFLHCFAALSLDLLQVSVSREHLVSTVLAEERLCSYLRGDVMKLQKFAENLTAWLDDKHGNNKEEAAPSSLFDAAS